MDLFQLKKNFDTEHFSHVSRVSRRTRNLFAVCYNLLHHIWDKVFKNGPNEICGRQPLKNLNCYGLLK